MSRFQNLAKRSLCALLSLVCLVCLALPALASEEEETASAPAPRASMIHSRPSAGSAAIGQLEDGTQVTVLDKTRDYFKIDCYEMQGYISKKQVEQSADGNYYVKCTDSSSDTSDVNFVSMADALMLRSSIQELSKNYLGTRYVYGGSRPGGFDCSGFTSYIYSRHNYTLQRCADQQMQDGLIIPKDSLQIGDLVFFRASGTPWLASHVGIYVGDNQMIHAGGGGIEYSSLDMPYYAKSYVGARRVFNVNTDGIEIAPSIATEAVSMARSTIGIRTAR